MMGRKKTEDDDGKWYPGKFLGKKPKSPKNSEGSQKSEEESQQQTDDDDDTEVARVCFGCRYGETPGERVLIKLKDEYIKCREKAMQIGKNPYPFGQAKLYKLERGSLYGTGVYIYL